MPDTFTSNLNLTQPEVGSSADTWGTKLNADLVALDALFAASGSGVVVRHDASDNAATVGVTISKAAGNGRWLQFLTSGSLRWLLGANTTAEGGANAGSDFAVGRYDDSGSLLGAPVSIARATGVVTFETTPFVTTNAIYHQGNTAAFAPVIGAIDMYAGSSDPSIYWLLCDGRALNRTTYATLFAAIGTTYGVGNGTTTFNIPNTAERAIVGKSGSQTLITQFDATVLGHTFGEGVHTLTTTEMPTHNHTLTDPGHQHQITPMRSSQTTLGSGSAVWAADSGTKTTATGAGTLGGDPAVGTGITLANAGSGASHNNVQPSLVLNFIMRVQ